MVRISEVSFTNRTNCTFRKILRFRSHNHNNNNNRLPSKLSGWLANRGGTRFSKPIEEISQEELNSWLCVSTHLRLGLQLQKFIYEIRTSGHNVRFLRSAPRSKTIKTSASVYSYCASRQACSLNTCTGCLSQHIRPKLRTDVNKQYR